MFVSFIAFLSALIHRDRFLPAHRIKRRSNNCGIQMHFSPNREDTTLSEHQICKVLTEFLKQLIC